MRCKHSMFKCTFLSSPKFTIHRQSSRNSGLIDEETEFMSPQKSKGNKAPAMDSSADSINSARKNILILLIEGTSCQNFSYPDITFPIFYPSCSILFYHGCFQNGSTVGTPKSLKLIRSVVSDNWVTNSGAFKKACLNN